LIGTVEVAAYFKKTEPTIRAWANEFSEYLSPLANPGKGKGRSFTPEDLMVFSLVSEMKDRNHTFEDIHAALKMGQRGDPPNLSENDLKILKATEGEKRAVFEIQALQQHIVDLRTRLNQAETQLAKAQEISQDNIRLKAQLEFIQDNLNSEQSTAVQLREELRQAQEEIKRLSREVGQSHGQAYIDGYKDGLREQGRGENTD
jgi:DNA-binding transcriptional MerR regulator